MPIDQTDSDTPIDTSKMTPERRKAFLGYVEALRAVFELDDDRRPIRVAMQRKGEDKPCAFAIVVLPDDISETGRMAFLSEIGRNILPPFRMAELVMPPDFGHRDIRLPCSNGFPERFPETFHVRAGKTGVFRWRIWGSNPPHRISPGTFPRRSRHARGVAGPTETIENPREPHFLRKRLRKSTPPEPPATSRSSMPSAAPSSAATGRRSRTSATLSGRTRGRSRNPPPRPVDPRDGLRRRGACRGARARRGVYLGMAN